MWWSVYKPLLIKSITWQIVCGTRENKLHWMLDVNFSEDACTVKKENAPEILPLIRRVVLNMLSLDTTQPAFANKH